MHAYSITCTTIDDNIVSHAYSITCTTIEDNIVSHAYSITCTTSERIKEINKGKKRKHAQTSKQETRHRNMLMRQL